MSPSTFNCGDAGPNTVTLSVSDKNGNVSTASAIVTVIDTNEPLNISPLELPEWPQRVNTTVNAQSAFTGANPIEAHFFWGDGTASEAIVNNGLITGSHEYQTPGTYSITLATTDPCGGRNFEIYQYLVVFNPHDPRDLKAEGAIWSNPGAYLYNPTKEGIADFKLKAKYKVKKKKGKKGRNDQAEEIYEPKGKTAFKFKEGKLDFKSTSYDWLVLTDEKAIVQGVGKIKRKKGYRFMMSLVPGQNQEDQSKFRMKIWTNDDVVVYDNQRGADLDEEVVTEVIDGAVDIQNGKGDKDDKNARIAEDVVLEEELKEKRIEVYPNPFKNSFTINYVGNQDSREVKLTMLDLSGKTIYQKSYDPEMHQEFNINFEGRPIKAGVYFLHLDDGKEKKIFKLIKM